MQRDSLILYAKIEDLFFQVHPTLRNFPKSEKLGVCLQIKNTFLKILESVALAKEVVSRRKSLLQSASGYIQNLYTLLRLSRSSRYISKGFFEVLDLKLTEIKKILSGWLRTLGNRKAS